MNSLVNILKLTFAICIFLLFSSMSGCEKTDEHEEPCILTEWDDAVEYKVTPRLKLLGTDSLDIRHADTMYLFICFYKWDCEDEDIVSSGSITSQSWVCPNQMTDDEFYREFYTASERFYFNNDLDFVSFYMWINVTIDGMTWGCVAPVKYGFPLEFDEVEIKDDANEDYMNVYFDVYYDIAGFEWNYDDSPLLHKTKFKNQ